VAPLKKGVLSYTRHGCPASSATIISANASTTSTSASGTESWSWVHIATSSSPNVVCRKCQEKITVHWALPLRSVGFRGQPGKKRAKTPPNSQISPPSQPASTSIPNTILFCAFLSGWRRCCALRRGRRSAVSTHTRTLSRHHTLFSHSNRMATMATLRSLTHSRSLSLSPLSLSLARSLAHPLSLSHTCTHTNSLHSRSLIHTNCTHTLSLSFVCSFSYLLSFACKLSPSQTFICVPFCTFYKRTRTRHTNSWQNGQICIYTNLFFVIQFRFSRACGPSSLSLVLTPFFGIFVSHSQSESDCEHLSVCMHTQFDCSYVDICMHRCVELSFAVSLALSLPLCLSPCLSRPFQSMHAVHVFFTLAFAHSLPLSLPPSLQTLCLSLPRVLCLPPSFPASVP